MLLDILRLGKDWAEGWYHTLRIKFRQPGLYAVLSNWTDDDLIGVEEPE